MNEHIEKLSTEIASGFGALKRIRPFAPPDTLHFIYNSLIQPHFGYCSVVWGNYGKTHGTLPNYKNCKIGRHGF